MAYRLDATTIKAPQRMSEENSTQMAQQRTLDGSVNRDYFGTNKRVWIAHYRNVQKADYDTIKGKYDTHLSTGNALTWEVTETNYTISQTSVHVDLQIRRFRVGGKNYISDFDLILVEA